MSTTYRVDVRYPATVQVEVQDQEAQINVRALTMQDDFSKKEILSESLTKKLREGTQINFGNELRDFFIYASRWDEVDIWGLLSDRRIVKITVNYPWRNKKDVLREAVINTFSIKVLVAVSGVENDDIGVKKFYEMKTYTNKMQKDKKGMAC